MPFFQLSPCPSKCLCTSLKRSMHSQHSRSLLYASLADTLIPPGVLSQEDAQARIPRGSGSAASEAQQRLQSWGSQMDLWVGIGTSTALSLPSPDRSSASYQSWEACAAVSSAPIEAQTRQHSDSEELDVVSVNATGFATSVSSLLRL